MKTIIQLLLAALVVHATYRAGVVYLRYYEFKDDVTQIAQFGVRRTDTELKSNVLDAARRREIPLNPDAIRVRRENHHIMIDAQYLEQVELVPRYFYPWTANVNVDVLTLILQEAK